MSAFAEQLHAFTLKVEARNQAIFVNTVSAVKSSITDGSPLTGAPGQPVDTGALKNSWQMAFNSATQATISTNIKYAPVIEEGIGRYGPLTLRSQVGGFGSVKLTRAGFNHLVADETQKAVANG